MNALALPLHFLRPWWWLALLPLPLVLWALARGGGRAMLARLADAALLPHLVRNAGARGRGALALVALAWLLAVAALAGPAWQKMPTPLYVNGAARVVVLSLSDDMLAQDLTPDRMTRARFAVRDLLDAAGDARTALVAYAGAAFTVAPLTDDRRTVLNLLGALAPDVMPVPGNDAAAGLARAVELLQRAHVAGGEIVLVTDTAGAGAVAAARRARALGIKVDVLGIGTDAGAPVPEAGGGFAGGTGGLRMARRDDAALRAVAEAGGGRYAVLRADGGVAALGAPVATHAGVRGPERAQLWRDGGIWLLPLLVALAALAFRRGWLLLLVVCAWPLGMPAAHAASWDSLWANRDQRAAQALRQGDAARARALAAAPGLRGAAAYRADDFAAAAQAFAQGRDARSRYNLGNALAKQGDYAKAIAAYRGALDRDPKFADARANLASVEDWLKRHPQPSSSANGPANRSAGSGSPASGSGASGKQPGGAQSASGDGASKGGGAASGAPPPGSAGGAAQDQNAAASSSSNNAASNQGGAPSAAEAARQRAQSAQAARGLAQALQQAQPGEGKQQGPGAQAFALGRAAQDRDGRFNAEQRAMLQAVPDDPGALLRRKFRLEWEQRHGSQPEEGQP